MSILSATSTLYIIECPACRRSYAINANLREEGESWRCPYLDCSKPGWTWSRAEKSKEELLRDELALKEKELQRQKENVEWHRQRREETAAERDHFRKSRDGMRGALVKTQRRVKCGVCPCCNRSFTELARHMATKHPCYAAPTVEAA